MVRLLLLGAAVLTLTACETDRYLEPIKPKPHGEAVRTNMHAHIIDPNPPASRPSITDGNRPVLAYDAYRKDEVKEPSREDAAASTAAVK